MCCESIHTGVCIRAVSDTHQHTMQGHSWGVANITRKASSPSTWLIEASVAPAGDDGRRLLQVRTWRASPRRSWQEGHCIPSEAQHRCTLAPQSSGRVAMGLG